MRLHEVGLCAAVFNQKKRGAVRGSHKSRASQDDTVDGSDEEPGSTEAAAGAASKTAEGLMHDLRQRLRARSKEVLVLVRIAGLNILSPAHIQAVIETVSEVPGSMFPLVTEVENPASGAAPAAICDCV